MLSSYKSFTPNSLSSGPEVMEIASSRSSEGHLERILQEMDEKLCSLLKVGRFCSLNGLKSPSFIVKYRAWASQLEGLDAYKVAY